jgi:hypothetical protein
MHVVYKTVAPGEVDRIIDYCSHHNVKNGGLFEVYPGADGGLVMVIVNSCSESGPQGKLRPLGAFYLNYSGPGVISIEEEDPHFDGAESRKRHVAAIKQVIDILLKAGFPGNTIAFQDLPALND